MEKSSYLSIKQWAEADRPREKLLQKGVENLTDAEIIAILIGSGTREISAVELAKQILNSVDNDLNELAKLGVQKLIKNYKGIGEAKAISIVAALELGKRRRVLEIKEKNRVNSSKDIAYIFQPIISELHHEEFWFLTLNTGNRILGRHRLSQGGLSATVADVRIIMKEAIDKQATALVLCHNHPSGNSAPSNEDINLTKRISKAANLFNIRVLDHVIVTESGYFSFADEEMMP